MAKLNKYNTVVVPNLEKIKHARMNGASFVDIANMLNISETTLHKYRREYTEFAKVMDEATANMTILIETTAVTSLLDKLKGGMRVVEEIVEDGIVVKQKRKWIPADTTAIIFALKARNPKAWDPLGVARLKDENEQNEINKQIMDALNKYNPNYGGNDE